ncbi:hypothetical protein ROZALSC1DRAFT_27942 [Rozella allomycis CSF55]|uniref:Uncharacterized protein n=1 Tax=Rozella allomycis (strain CSF55) TaxID=988480 RepID=A0A4P9YLN6_ROZAC|nr:hypothetical protein ROZALSC1DRAFT_27942 [Rozella allomycis CSF55]
MICCFVLLCLLLIANSVASNDNEFNCDYQRLDSVINSTVYFSDLTFLNCRGFEVTTGGSLYLSNIHFYGSNIQKDNGGFLYAHDGGHAVLNNVTILNSKAVYGGAIAAYRNSSIKANNLRVYNSTSVLLGGTISLYDGSRIECERCDFHGSKSLSSGLFDVGLNSKLIWKNSIVNDIFSSNFGGLGQAYDNSYVEMRNVIGYNINSSIVSLIYCMNNCSLWLDNVQFSDMFSTLGVSGISVLDHSYLIIKNSNFKNLTSKREISFLEVNYDSKAIIDNSTIQDVQCRSNGAIVIDNNSKLIIKNESKIINSIGSQGGAIAVLGGTAYCEDSEFKNNLADTGGSVFVHKNAVFETHNCSFNGNKATVGGALFSEGTVVIDATVFINNTAFENGGAVSFNAGSQLFISGNSIFRYNKAEIFGGGIYLSKESSISLEGYITAENNNAIRGSFIYSRQSDADVFRITGLNVYSKIFNHIFFSSNRLAQSVKRNVLPLPFSSKRVFQSVIDRFSVTPSSLNLSLNETLLQTVIIKLMDPFNSGINPLSSGQNISLSFSSDFNISLPANVLMDGENVSFALRLKISNPPPNGLIISIDVSNLGSDLVSQRVNLPVFIKRPIIESSSSINKPSIFLSFAGNCL